MDGRESGPEYDTQRTKAMKKLATLLAVVTIAAGAHAADNAARPGPGQAIVVQQGTDQCTMPLFANQHLTNIPAWPVVGQSNLEAAPRGGVNRPFTVGCWADFAWMECPWCIASDEDGFGGHPWTNVAPGIGYPTGWQNPGVLWGPCQSLGFGVFFDAGGPSPAPSTTWGEIKGLFQLDWVSGVQPTDRSGPSGLKRQRRCRFKAPFSFSASRL
jgi:hypothetical protein